MRGILLFFISFSSVQSFAIWSGNAIPKGQWTETVLIKNADATCTGVLIHSNVLLTAAHCNKLLSLRVGAKLSLSWTEYNVTIRAKMWTINVHPLFPKSFDSNDFKLKVADAASDLVVIVFAEDVGSMVLKKGINIQYPLIGNDQNFTFNYLRSQRTISVGAGTTRKPMNGSDDAPVGKRWVTQGLRGINGGLWSAGSLEAKKGVCSGDSGSGLFVAVGGTNNLVAIQSSVLNANICDSSKNAVFYVPIYLQACWIAKVLRPYNITANFDSSTCSSN